MRLIGVLIVLALLLELAIRILIGVPRDERLPLIRVQPDSRLGYKPLVGDVHYGYDELIKLNSLGLRGAEVTAKKTKEYRILVFGGTQVYGLGIPDHELMTSVLEDRLNQEQSDQQYRIINFGVRAFTLRQQYLLLKDVGVGLNPDHVVLVIDGYSFGDFDILKYYTHIKGHDWFMLDLGDKPEGIVLGRWYLVQAARKSALVAWLHHHYKVWTQRNSVSNKLLHGVKDSEIDQRFSFVTEQIGAFAALAKEYNFVLSLAVLPLVPQVSHASPNLFYQTELGNLAKARGLSFLDLLGPLRQLYQRMDHVPVAPFDAHYNALAHETIASALQSQVREDSANEK